MRRRNSQGVGQTGGEVGIAQDVEDGGQSFDLEGAVHPGVVRVQGFVVVHGAAGQVVKTQTGRQQDDQ